MKNLFLLALILTVCSIGFAQSDKAAKLTAEDVVAKHLASIGTPEDIAAAKTRVMVGQGILSGKAALTGRTGGPAQIASTGNMFLLAMIFPNTLNYPYEKLAFDGKNVTVGVPAGERTDLGNFLKLKSAILKEGLFGGTLSAGWPLLDVAGKKVKVSYSGLVELSGRKFHKLKYTSNVGDLTVSLYFEPETFRHVLSEYKYKIEAYSSGDSGVQGSVGDKSKYYSLTEQFSDYKTVGKLTLPFAYAINVTKQEEGALSSIDWQIKLTDFYFNEPLTADVFKVS
jgi:hypothetical protein